MAAQKKNLFQINLLAKRDEEFDLQKRLIKWILSSGRYVVIFVEIIVVGAFVYRYKLDSDLSTIQDRIKEEVPYVKSLKNDEDQIRQTQFQLKSIKLAKSQSLDYVKILQTIASLTPKTIILTSLTLDQTQTFPNTTFTVIGNTPSNVEVSAFIQALKNNNRFTNVNLTNISFSGSTTFTITGNIVAQNNTN